MGHVRIQKFLSNAGVLSRRAAEEAIAAGRVRLNGIVVRELWTTIDPTSDVVELDGLSVAAPTATRLVLLNKPAGIVSTMKDPHEGDTLSAILPEEYRGLFPVGRLDRETTGLLIFTNDGDLAERLLHPRYELLRVYEAIVSGAFTEASANAARRGVELDDGAASATIEVVQRSSRHTKLTVKIGIGRKRVVRRLLAALGHPVTALKRLSHGPITLGKLPEGQFFELPKERCEELKKEIFSGI